MNATLNLAALTLSANGRAVVLKPRNVAILAALARCYPGCVTDRLLMDLRARRDAHRLDGYATTRIATIHIRAALASVGIPQGIERRAWLAVRGHRLTVPVEIVGDDASAMRMAA